MLSSLVSASNRKIPLSRLSCHGMLSIPFGRGLDAWHGSSIAWVAVIFRGERDVDPRVPVLGRAIYDTLSCCSVKKVVVLVFTLNTVSVSDRVWLVGKCGRPKGQRGVYHVQFRGVGVGGGGAPNNKWKIIFGTHPFSKS